MKIETLEQAIAVIESAGYFVRRDLPEYFLIAGAAGILEFITNDRNYVIEFARKCQLKAFW